MKVELTRPAAQSRPPLTEAALCAWVGSASPGDRLVYHRGYLAIDTGPDSRTVTPARRRELRALADRAWKLAEEGLIHLVQHRESIGNYSYIAVVRRRPRRDGGVLRAVLLAADLGDGEMQPSTVATRRSA